MKNIPLVFSEYISGLEPVPVDFMECKSVQYNLSKDDAMNDFELFRYLIDNAYSGKEYWEKQGISFLQRCERVQKQIQEQETIRLETLYNFMCYIFSDVHDGHIYVSHALIGHRYFQNTYRAYFADVLLEKRNDNFIVIKSNNNDVVIGDKIENNADSKSFFPTLSPKGKQHYLLGLRSWEPVQNMEIKVNDKFVSIQLHACKQSKSNNNGIFQFDFDEKHPIVKSSRFWESDNENYENTERDFENIGKELRNKPYVIWDIHDNIGGNSNYPEAFIRGLNDSAKWYIDCAVLSSPAVEQARGAKENLSLERKWELYEADRGSKEPATYKGVLYVLIGEKVASSGEAAVSQAMNTENCVLIGSNTGGVGTFGDVLTYELTNSKILVRLPYKLFLGGPREGEGYTPHFWVDTDNLLEETIRWLENPETYTAI